ncbi:MAG: ribbon-helix-helix domain-containing protein [Hellea sp.]
MIKRSLSIHGHRTSLALEAEFWRVIDEAVKQSGKSFAGFIRDLDDIRTASGTDQNLASYLRVWVLNDVQAARPPRA